MQKHKVLKYLLLVSSFLLVSACNAEEDIIVVDNDGAIDFKGMEEAQKKHNEQARSEALLYMDIETMFPDESVRALAEAAGKGKLKKVDELVAQGINVNSRGKKNATPLYWALRNFEGFEKLLQLGADPNLLIADATAVVHSAAQHKDIRFLKAVLDYGGDPNLTAGHMNETPIFNTIGLRTMDLEEAMFLLLDSGADINIQNEGEQFGMPWGGTTPLIKASNLGRYDIVYKLLEKGADPTIKTVNDIDLQKRIARDLERGGFTQEGLAEINKVVDWLEKNKTSK